MLSRDLALTNHVAGDEGEAEQQEQARRVPQGGHRGRCQPVQPLRHPGREHKVPTNGF